MSEPSAAPIASPRVAYLRRGAARALDRIAVATIGILSLSFFGAVITSSLTRAGQAEGAEVLAAGAAVALLLSVVAFFLDRSFLAPRGTIRCSSNDLVIEGAGARTVPLATIEAGFVVPTRTTTSVELHLKGGDVIDIQLEHPDAAAALLHAAKVDVAQQRCRIQLVDPTARMFMGLAAAGGLAYGWNLALEALASVVPGASGALVWASVMVLAALLALRATSLLEVTIGTDGLAFRRGFRETFVPFEELAEIRPNGLGVVVRLRSGRALTIFSPAGVGPARFEALLLRIREAMAARARGQQPALELLDRRGRSVQAWRIALGEIARRGTSYRDVGISLDDLEAVIRSPDASGERRLAAAVALRAAAHPAAVSLIRVAAAQCASPRVRVALEHLSEGEGDDAALAEALDEEEAPLRAIGAGPRR